MSTPTTQLTEEERNLAAVAGVLPYWNAHDLDGVLDWYDPDIVWHNVALEEMYRGKEEVGTFVQSLFTALPDLTFEVTERVAEGPLIAEQWLMSGTHDGEFLGVPPTRRRLRIEGMSMVRMREGRFLRDDFYFDASSVMRQLGLMPALSAARGRAGRTVLGVVVRLGRLRRSS
ncbi:ester cyclase [Flindersiella endophytica]